MKSLVLFVGTSPAEAGEGKILPIFLVLAETFHCFFVDQEQLVERLVAHGETFALPIEGFLC